MKATTTNEAVGATGHEEWLKSHACVGGECLEVLHASGGNVQLRDSKNPHGPRLSLSRAEWDAFLIGVLSGDFDRA